MTTEPTAEKADFAQTQKAIVFLVILAIAGIYFFVIKRNSPPVAVNNSYSGTENKNLSISIRFDDPDFDRDGYEERVKLFSVGQASNGTVQIEQASSNDGKHGRISYTPNPNFYGNDSFSYTVADKRGEKTEGTLSIYIRKSEERIAREEREEEERAEAERRRLEAEAIAQAIEEYFMLYFPKTGGYLSFPDHFARLYDVETPPTRVLLEEGFDSHSSKWNTWGSFGSDASYAVIRDGELYVETDKPNYLHYSVIDIKHKNFLARFDMKIHNQPTTNTSGGFIFSHSDQGYYFLEMNYANTTDGNSGDWTIKWNDSVNNKWSRNNWVIGRGKLSSRDRRVTFYIAALDNFLCVCRHPELQCSFSNNLFRDKSGAFTSKMGEKMAFVSSDQDHPVSFDNFVVLELPNNIRAARN